MSTNGATDKGLVSPSDIAAIAGVSRGAVSNWRKRAKDFPRLVAGTEAKPLFSREQVTAWLIERGHSLQTDAGQTDVWSALNSLRGELSIEQSAQLVLGLAVRRVKPDSRLADMPNMHPRFQFLEDTINHIAPENLAAAADFVLERLAKAQGRGGAEYGFVGSRTSTLLASLAATRSGGVLYDPACGIGAALLASVAKGARPNSVIGHDVNVSALRVAEQRAILHGVDMQLNCTDVLAEDVDASMRADVVIAEPPFGLKFDPWSRLIDDRFVFGPPPRSSADMAWIQHAVFHLSDSGRAYVLTPIGSLFRTGQERDIRAELVRRGCIEAVVALPGKLLPQTSIQLALWVLRRPTNSAANDSVLLIDATESKSPETKVAEWLQGGRQDIPHAEVSAIDIITADATLMPQRWIEKVERDPDDVRQAFIGGLDAIGRTMTELREAHKSFEAPVEISNARLLSIDELIEQKVVEVRVGRSSTVYESAPDSIRARVVSAGHVRDGLPSANPDVTHAEYPEMTRSNDVLVTTMNKVRARVDATGGHVPSTGVHRLRILDTDVLSPSYLALMLTGSWNEQFQEGSTIKRASVRDLQVPLVRKSDQLEVVHAADSINRIRRSAVQLATHASTTEAALLEAVHDNVSLSMMNPANTKGTK